jgi:hypothetical protein
VRAIAAAAVAAAVLVGVHLGLGGGTYEPSRPPDPCSAPEAASAAGGLAGTLERVGLNALAASACELGVTRERLLLALADERQLGIDDERRNDAFRTGLREAIDAEHQAGRLSDPVAFVLRQAVRALPVDLILDRIFGEGL